MTNEHRSRRLGPFEGRRPPSLLTGRGWGLVAFVALAVLAARLFGIEELYGLAAAAVVAVLYAIAWTSTRRWTIDVSREVRPGRVEAGHGAVVVVTLENRSGATSPVLKLRDPFDGGGRVSELLVAPIGPHRRITGTYHLRPTGRGVFAVGPLTLETSDPLGLARRVRPTAGVSTFIVHPRLERLRPPRVPTGTGRDQAPALAVPGRDNDEFASLREYQPGDDIRRMHWPSTARTDTLMVREDQIERRGRYCVVLDSRSHLWSPPSFERATAAAASIAVAALDAGLHTRLLTTAGSDSTSGSGRGHRSKILDLLAGATMDDAEPAPGRAGVFNAPLLPEGGTVAVVTSDRADLVDLQRLARRGTRTDVLMVVVERSTPAGASSRPEQVLPGSSRVVTVTAAAGLARSWDRIA